MKYLNEIFDFIFASYDLCFILPLVVYICTQRDDSHRIQQSCFIYRFIFAIPALRKRRVQGALPKSWTKAAIPSPLGLIAATLILIEKK